MLSSEDFPLHHVFLSFFAVIDVVFRVAVGEGDVNKNMYYVLLAADSEGNIGQMGNIVKAYMPRYGPWQNPSKT